MKEVIKFYVLLCAIQVTLSEYYRICYFTNWAQYRQGDGNYDITKHYEKGLCTHIIYAFAKVENAGNGQFPIVPYEWNDQSAGYGKVNALKKQDLKLKTLLAIGGWTHASEGFTQMVKTKESRENFVKTAVAYVIKWGFDGLDIDWEYPAQRNGTAEDKPLFTTLCKELKAAFGPLGLILSAAVGAGKKHVDKSYEVSELSKHLDFLNIMSYDLNEVEEGKVKHHTNSNSSLLIEREYSADNTIDYWIKKGADPKKIVLGMATYGRTLELKDPCKWKLGSLSKKIGGAKGKITGDRGLLAYYEICKLKFRNKVCTKSSTVNAPYGASGPDFVGYDDEESIAHKVITIAKGKGLKGIFFWALDFDDFHGNCGAGTYPLIKAATNALNGIQPSFSTCKEIDKTCVPGKEIDGGETSEPDRFNTGDYIRVCYITNWAQYRKGVAKYDVSKNYEKGMCTHIIYAFAKVENRGDHSKIEPFEWNDESVGYNKANDLKKSDPNLKTLLAVGGWNHASEGFTQMVKTKARRTQFIEDAAKYLIKWGFNGLDLDWEYPSLRNGSAEDKPLYTLLCKELKEHFHPLGLIVTAAVSASVNKIDISYEIAEVSKHVDFLNIMSYDLYGPQEARTDHHTDMNPNRGPTEESMYNTINHWLDNGADPTKVVLGLATYGKTMEIKKECEWDIGSATNEIGGMAGLFTGERGLLANFEICKMQWKNRVCTTSSKVHAPYGLIGRDFVGYDDEASIAHKVKKFAIEKKLKGIMFWTLDFEDFNNVCGGGTFPLIKAAIKTLQGKLVSERCHNIHTCGKFPVTLTTTPTTTIITKPAVVQTTKHIITSTTTTTVTTKTLTTTLKPVTVPSTSPKTTSPEPEITTIADTTKQTIQSTTIMTTEEEKPTKTSLKPTVETTNTPRQSQSTTTDNGINVQAKTTTATPTVETTNTPSQSQSTTTDNGINVPAKTTTATPTVETTNTPSQSQSTTTDNGINVPAKTTTATPIQTDTTPTTTYIASSTTTLPTTATTIQKDTTITIPTTTSTSLPTTLPVTVKPTLNPNYFSRVCYFSTLRIRRGQFNIKRDFENDLCTHLIYTDGYIINNHDGTYLLDVHGFKDTLKMLKSNEKSLKILLGIGTHNVPKDGFPNPIMHLVKSTEARQRFIKYAALYLKDHGFDGLDVTWDAEDSSLAGYKFAFTLLCKELKNHFQPRGLIVTASVSGNINIIDKMYEVRKLSNILHFINVMSYNMHSDVERLAIHHSDTSANRRSYEQTVKNAISHWLSSGASPRKLIMGISTYGKTYNLLEPGKWNLGSTVNPGGGLAGKDTKQSGVLAYYEICKIKWKNRICTTSSSVNAPYGTDGQDFITYDDSKSIQYKVKNIVMKLNLRGIMISRLSYDDYNNQCGGGRFPLLKAARNTARSIDYLPSTCSDVKSVQPLATTTTTKTITTTKAATSQKPSNPNDNGESKGNSDVRVTNGVLTYLIIIVAGYILS